MLLSAPTHLATHGNVCVVDSTSGLAFSQVEGFPPMPTLLDYDAAEEMMGTWAHDIGLLCS